LTTSIALNPALAGDRFVKTVQVPKAKLVAYPLL
jgi:hypothetical protein